MVCYRIFWYIIVDYGVLWYFIIYYGMLQYIMVYSSMLSYIRRNMQHEAGRAMNSPVGKWDVVFADFPKPLNP